MVQGSNKNWRGRSSEGSCLCGFLVLAFIFVFSPVVTEGPDREVPQYGGTVNVDHAMECFP